MARESQSNIPFGNLMPYQEEDPTLGYSNIPPMPLDYQIPPPPALPNPYAILPDDEIDAIYQQPGMEPIPLGTSLEEIAGLPSLEYPSPRRCFPSNYETGEPSQPATINTAAMVPVTYLDEANLRRIVDEQITAVFPDFLMCVKDHLFPGNQVESNSVNYHNSEDVSPTTHVSETFTSPALSDIPPRRWNKGRRVCYACRTPGHLAKDCPRNGACYQCGSRGHLAKNCVRERRSREE